MPSAHQDFLAAGHQAFVWMRQLSGALDKMLEQNQVKAFLRYHRRQEFKHTLL
jgi:hypothetical protein